MKIWRFYVIPILINFDKLNITYDLILSKTYKNGIKTHAFPWLRDNEIHIIGSRHYISTACRLHIDVSVYIHYLVLGDTCSKPISQEETCYAIGKNYYKRCHE